MQICILRLISKNQRLWIDYRLMRRFFIQSLGEEMHILITSLLYNNWFDTYEIIEKFNSNLKLTLSDLLPAMNHHLKSYLNY